MSAKTVQAWLAEVGALYDANDPFASYYQTIANNENPQGAPVGNTAFIEACLRYRGIIYFKQRPGDCGTAVRTVSTSAAAEEVVGAAISKSGIPFAGTIGSIVGIFGAHHQAAVNTEQATICDVANKANQGISQLDSAVYNGVVSIQDGIMYMGNAMQQLIAELGTIEKSCNAACVMQSVCRAHVDFAKIFYAAIGKSVGSSTGTISTLSPASSLLSTATISAPTSNSTLLLILLAIVLGFIFLMR